MSWRETNFFISPQKLFSLHHLVVDLPEVLVHKVLFLFRVPVEEGEEGLGLEVVVGVGEEVVGEEVEDPPVGGRKHGKVQVIPGEKEGKSCNGCCFSSCCCCSCYCRFSCCFQKLFFLLLPVLFLLLLFLLLLLILITSCL